MEAFFEKYHNFRKKQSMKIILPALLLAIGINTFLFTESGQRIQTSVIEATQTQASADAQITIISENIATLQINSPAQDVDSLTATLVYDPTTLQVTSISPQFPDLTVTQITDSVPRVITFSFPDTIDIPAGTRIFDINYEKLIPEPAVFNIGDVHFKSGENIFQMTSEGSGEF